MPSCSPVLPRLPYGVRSMPPEEGNNAPHYLAGAIEAAAGYFEAKTNNLASVAALGGVIRRAVPARSVPATLANRAGPGVSALTMLRRRNGKRCVHEGWRCTPRDSEGAAGIYAEPYTWLRRLYIDSLRACRSS